MNLNRSAIFSGRLCAGALTALADATIAGVVALPGRYRDKLSGPVAPLTRKLHTAHKTPTDRSRRREEADPLRHTLHPPPHVGGYGVCGIPGLSSPVAVVCLVGSFLARPSSNVTAAVLQRRFQFSPAAPTDEFTLRPLLNEKAERQRAIGLTDGATLRVEFTVP